MYDEKWNATCGKRPATWRVDSEVSPAYFGFSWFIIVSNILLYVLTLILFALARRRFTYVRKRSFVALFLFALGAVLIIIVGPVRDVVGRANFPCEIALWFRIAGVSLIMTGVLTNLVQFYNALQWSKALATFSFQRLQEVFGNTDTTKASNANSVNHAQPGEMRGSSSVGGVTEDSASEITKSKLGSGSSFADESGLHKALQRRSIRAQILTLGLPCLPPIVAGIILEVTLPHYSARGCVGCYDPWYFTIALLASLSISGNLVIFYARALRGVKDPLDILLDLKIIFVFATLLGGPGMIGTIIDEFVDRPYDRGIFSFDWLILLGTLVAFLLQTYKPMYVAWKRSKQVGNQHLNASLRVLLKNAQFQMLFTTYLVNEWSIENLKFFNQIETFKTHFASLKDPETIALQTFETFITPGAMLEVNLSAKVRDSIAGILRSGKPATVDRTIFDAAQEDIFALMERDSFSRFQRTKEYQAFMEDNLVVDPSSANLVLVAGTV